MARVFWTGMRLQASLEFIMILAVVSVLALSAVVMYRNLAGNGKSLLHGISEMAVNTPNDTTPPQAERPGFSAYLPLNSLVGSDDLLQIGAFGCSNGSISYSLQSSTIAFSRQNASGMLDGIYTAALQFEPLSQGADTATMLYAIKCANDAVNGSLLLTTYASAQADLPGNHSQQYYAAIYSRNESVYYGINSSEQIDNFSQFNHCTKTDWLGNPLPMTSQCGTGSAYAWTAFDGSCMSPWWSYQRTYCIVPYPTNYRIAAGGAAKLEYSFTLDIGTDLGALTANFNGTNTSDVFLGSSDVGKARITGVYYAYGIQQAMLSNGSALLHANYTLYLSYEQTKSTTLSALSYYNNTGSGPEMEQALYAYGKSVASLEGSVLQSASSCSARTSGYACEAAVPFQYTINVTAAAPLTNQTLSYEGSIIRLSVSR